MIFNTNFNKNFINILLQQANLGSGFWVLGFSSENKSFDVAHRVMNLVCDKRFMPSDALIEEYRQSETTKTLNRFPSYQELKEKIGMEKYYYDRLKKTYRR